MARNCLKRCIINAEEIMKEIFRFETPNLSSLPTLLGRGIRAYATDEKGARSVTTLWLLLNDGACLRIRSKMHDLSGWDEIGTLVFEVVEVTEAPQFVDLPTSWMQVISIEALIFDSDECTAECGIMLHNTLGEILTVLPGADVYTLAIQAPFCSLAFSPENDIPRYFRRKM